MTKRRKAQPGTQVLYTYQLASGETALQYCRSFGEAASWAEIYERNGLVSWGAK